MAKDTVVLLHVDESEEVADVINGHLIILPPHEPVELDAFIGNAVLEHKGQIHGIVKVGEVRTKAGVQYKIEEAEEEAAILLASGENMSVNFYVRQQMEDRIAAGKPALPPNGRAALIVKRRKISLRNEFGLSPVGYKDEAGNGRPNVGDGGGSTTSASDAEKQYQQQIQFMREQNESLRIQQESQTKTIEALQKQFEQLMATLNPETA